MTDHCCAHPKCPGGSLCCCQGQPDPIERGAEAEAKHRSEIAWPAFRKHRATAALEAALPHLEAALRAQIAADIRAAADAADVDFIQVGNAHVRRNPYASGHYEEAARIAEEGPLE